ncbi:MAG: hypothetical protein KAV48_00060 [Methanomicrobia archaeon]|nr:hypothetical protein [Methanomicrobia archaeon]
MNKKTQFFLISAVIVCLMIFSVNRVFNEPPSTETETYYALYTSIKNACMDTVAYSDNISEDLDTLKEELNEFCKEANVNIILDYTIEGNSVEFYLKLFTPEILIEDPFKIVVSKMNVKIEDVFRDKIVVIGDLIKKEDFYNYEKIYKYNNEFVKPDKNGSEFTVDGYYRDSIPKIGVFSPIDLKYTPYEIIDKDLVNYDFIVVDSISGVDYEKSHILYEYLKNGGNILFIGFSGRNFVSLLNEEGTKILNMTKNDFYSDGTKLVMIGKGNVFLSHDDKSIIVYGDNAYENGEEITTGKIFFSLIEENYEDVLTEIIFTTFEKKEQKDMVIEVNEAITFTISDCKNLTLEINSEKFILTSSHYSQTLPLKKGEYRLVLRDETVIYKVVSIVIY